MSSLPPASVSTPVNPGTAASGDVKQVEESNKDVQMLNSGNGEVQNVNWESELQLVSSLAKLQELERKVSVIFNLQPFV